MGGWGHKEGYRGVDPSKHIVRSHPLKHMGGWDPRKACWGVGCAGGDPLKHIQVGG